MRSLERKFIFFWLFLKKNMVNKIGTAKLNLFDSSNVNDNTSRIDCIFFKYSLLKRK